MCNYTSWGSIFLFLSGVCAAKFNSTILWMVFYAVGIICFLLANRQEDKLFKRITRLESQLAAVTARINRNP